MHSAFVPFMVVVIESGTAYSSALASLLFTYAAGNNAQYIIIEFGCILFYSGTSPCAE